MRVYEIFDPGDLPINDTCSIESMAFVTDQTPQEVWDQGKEFWRDGGRLRSGTSPAFQSMWLKRMGWACEPRYDLTFNKVKVNGFVAMKTWTFGKFLKMMNNRPGRFLIHVRNHVVGYKDGKILDTEGISNKVKVTYVCEVTE